MIRNVSVRCICFALIMIGASTVSAKTLYLDEVEVKAELPKEPHDSFFEQEISLINVGCREDWQPLSASASLSSEPAQKSSWMGAYLRIGVR